jgi:D-glycero-alpha-D-manno-heptose-7-phosphate kinase
MHQMVDEGAAILRGDGSLQAFGELLHDGWMLKRSLADGVTTSKIDRVYESARASGAIGGKIMGAGGAGFMLLFVPPERQSDVRQAMDNYLFVSFALESNGSTIIYDDGTPWDRVRSKAVTLAHD